MESPNLKKRMLVKSNKRPDCPICLDDLTTTILAMAKDASNLEYNDSYASVRRVKDLLKLLDIQVTELRARVRNEVYPSVKEGISRAGRKRPDSIGMIPKSVKEKGAIDPMFLKKRL